MTTEEKARAYDEALEVMRQWIAPCHTKEQLDTLKKSVFPELVESEDERIRKAIIHYILYETKGAISEDTEHTWVKWLEKQKENPKSADSIPSNCVSNAKCEDRWHKVADYMPDNPREVLCKDEAGNYFIGRYYVGEGWEISNYDDEDKPHHLNPPVSKWIDFPSEKQKEKKPISPCDIVPYIDDKIAALQDMWREEKVAFDWDDMHEMIEDVARHFYQQEQKPEWSKEDEEKLERVDDLLWMLDDYLGDDCSICEERTARLRDEIQKELCPWLKSFRSCPKSSDNWKPSEEQMKALLDAEGFLRAGLQHDSAKTIAELYEQLKKL